MRRSLISIRTQPVWSGEMERKEYIAARLYDIKTSEKEKIVAS